MPTDTVCAHVATPSPAAPLPTAAAPPPASLRGHADAGLLDEATAAPDDRVLIIGALGPDLLCDALRHGCRAALEVVAPPAHPEPADVVIAPGVAGEAAASAVALCAKRALGAGKPDGRLALSLLGRDARTLARRLVDRLRGYGFARIRLRARPNGGLLLVCLLPRRVSEPVPACATAAGRVRRRA